MEERDLLDRCRAGDPLAWEALVRRHQGRVYSIALHYMGNAEEARDLAQEIFLRLYRRLDACTNDETFVPWMIRLARNVCIDHLRRARVRPRAAPLPVEEHFDLASPEPGPAEQWRLAKRRGLLQRALQRLTPINRDMIVLKEIQGMSLEEIASLLRIPTGTVKSRSNRARLELAREVLALDRRESAAGME
jgi:RNA polymerase sigma-70 factor (ECF subfamily)